jgi:hypothetical protein
MELASPYKECDISLSHISYLALFLCVTFDISISPVLQRTVVTQALTYKAKILARNPAQLIQELNVEKRVQGIRGGGIYIFHF